MNKIIKGKLEMIKKDDNKTEDKKNKFRKII